MEVFICCRGLNYQQNPKSSGYLDLVSNCNLFYITKDVMPPLMLIYLPIYTYILYGSIKMAIEIDLLIILN